MAFGGAAQEQSLIEQVFPEVQDLVQAELELELLASRAPGAGFLVPRLCPKASHLPRAVLHGLPTGGLLLTPRSVPPRTSADFAPELGTSAFVFTA